MSSTFAVYGSGATADYGGSGSREQAQAERYITRTAAYSAIMGDSVLADTSGGGWTLTLPSAPNSQGGEIRVKKIGTDANALTVVSVAGTIDGDASAVIDFPAVAVRFVSDGTNWRIF